MIGVIRFYEFLNHLLNLWLSTGWAWLPPQRTEELFSEDYFWDQIFKIGEIESLRSVSNKYGAPFSTLHDRIQGRRKETKVPRLAIKGDVMPPELKKLQRWSNGRLSPISAKVAIDARKWIASRFHPNQFSEKLMKENNLDKTDIAKLHLQELKKMMDKSKELTP